MSLSTARTDYGARNVSVWTARLRRRLAALEGYLSRRAIARRWPELDAAWRLLGAATSGDLSGPYRDYLTSVSGGMNPVSLEMSTFLLLQCSLVRPARVLDLGSGFSSYVFRSYQRLAGHPIRVWSVDDDPRWLEKTRQFLAQHDLPTFDLLTWDAIAGRYGEPYDLVFYDSWVHMKERQREFIRVLPWVRPGSGVLILDDYHKSEYRAHVEHVLKGTPHSGYSLYAYTHDKFGRYAQLLTDLPGY